MSETLKNPTSGSRAPLSRSGGQPETVTVSGRPTVLRHAGEGRPFVYLHSTLGESFLWFPHYKELARHFRVLVPTHPGFGQSGGFDQMNSIEDMAFHYLELFDALGLEKVVLGGVSLGGWIAAEFAVRWPERVSHLWLADALGLWVPEEPLPDLFRMLQDQERLREVLFHDPECHMARLLFADSPSEERQLTGFQSLTVLARLAWERPYDPKLADRLHRVQCPTLLVWGANDRLVPPPYGEAYRRHLPRAELKLIPDCGHLPMFERETEFVQTLVTFAQG